MSFPIRVVAAAALALSAAALPAQDEVPAAPARYAVEVIVFRYLDQAGTTTESPPLRTDARDQSGPAPGFLLLDPGGEIAMPEPLPAGALALDGVWRRLERLDAYQPLVHLGWTQAVTSRDRAEPYVLVDPASRAAGLTGGMRLYKERFLHLAVDLALSETVRDVQDPAGTAAAWRAFRIDESRRLRGDELQYFDNPRFGVLASVREVAPPVPAAAAR